MNNDLPVPEYQVWISEKLFGDFQIRSISFRFCSSLEDVKCQVLPESSEVQ